LGLGPFWDRSPTLGFFFSCYFVFDLVVVFTELFLVMRVAQQKLPKLEAKLGFFYYLNAIVKL
jgi:hypothetical protein